MPESTPNDLTSGRLLARNTIFNFVGQAAPLLLALIAIPLLIDGLGTDRFGVLTLTWIIIAYFGLFDLGLSRSMTKLVAEKLGTGQEQETYPIIWTTLFLLLLLGLVGTAVVSLLSPLLVRDVLKIPEALQSETLRAFYLLALSIPVVFSTFCLRGVLEAQQRFGLVTAVRIPTVSLTLLGPLLVLPFSRSLVPVMAVLVMVRLLAWLASLLCCFRVMPTLYKEMALQRTAIGPLFRLGGWMTVSNVLWPLMMYVDRLFVGSLISITAVAYYSTPQEMVTKLWFIPTAVIGVLFPAFVTSLVQDPGRTALLFGRGVKYTFLALFPLVLLVVTLANEGLDLWLGAEFAQNSTLVLQLLAVGMLFFGPTQIPLGLIQGAGRPDLAAKVHLVELPLYLLALWWLLGIFGIEGAAIAWVVRLVADALVLFAMVPRFLPNTALNRRTTLRRTAIIMGVSLLTLVLAALPAGLVVKGVFLSLALSAYVLATWFLILTPAERTAGLEYLKLNVISTGRDKL